MDHSYPICLFLASIHSSFFRLFHFWQVYATLLLFDLFHFWKVFAAPYLSELFHFWQVFLAPLNTIIYLIHFYFLFHFCLFVYVFPSISMLHSNLNSVFPQLGLFASLRIYHPMWGTLGFANWEVGLGSLMANLCNIFFLQHFFLLPVFSDNTLFTFISIVHNFFAFPDLHFLLFSVFLL